MKTKSASSTSNETPKATKPKSHKKMLLVEQPKAPAPTIHGRVRFDTLKGQWCLLNDDNGPSKWFEEGYLLDATFESVTVTERVARGCGWGTENIQIGVATGDLAMNATYMGSKTKFHNLKFVGKFVDDKGTECKRAAVIVLQPNRKAVYAR